MLSNTTEFYIQFAISLVVFTLMAVWYVKPWLKRLPIRQAMTVLLAPHILHRLGLAMLVTTVVSRSMPTEYAWLIAVGDMAVLVAALASMYALRRGTGSLAWQ